MSDFYLVGSLCLSDIPKELIKKANNGKLYLNISVSERREPKTFTNPDGRSRTITHYISCAPKKDDRKEGVNYYIADLEQRGGMQMASQPITPEQVENAPVATDLDDLPF